MTTAKEGSPTPWRWLLLPSVIPILIMAFGCASGSRGPKVAINEFVNENTPGYYEERAKYYYNHREYKKAIREYERLVEKFSPQKERYLKQLAWAHYEIGFCHLVMKQYKRASEFFEIVVNNYDVLAASTLAKQRLVEIERHL